MNIDEWHEQAGRAAYEAIAHETELHPNAWVDLADETRELWRGVARAVLREGKIEIRHDHLADLRSVQRQLDDLREALALGEASDGHHTHNELYEYRLLYNALAVLAFQAAGWRVVKSYRHSNGELCFGNTPEWFIVHAETPAGQITNHYRREYWHHFAGIEEVKQAPTWDGHTPEVATMRLEASIEFLRQAFEQRPEQPEYTACTGCAHGCAACAGVFRPGGFPVPDND